MNDVRPGDAGENLTEFGECFQLFTRLLDTNPTQVSKRAQVGRATLADLIHPKPDGRAVRPDRQTLEKLWTAIQQFAIERSGYSLSDGYRQGFWYAARHGPQEQEEQDMARMRLQELTLVVAILEKKERQIQELRRENNALSKRKRRR